MRPPSTSKLARCVPWTWRIGGPLAAVICIEIGASSVGLVILGWAIFLDVRWWLEGRRRA
jgi:hypothetical protein